MPKTDRPTEDLALARCKDLTAEQIKKNLARGRAKKELIQPPAEADVEILESEEAKNDKLEIKSRGPALSDCEPSAL